MKKVASLTAALLLLLPATASATEKGWRYWGYFQSAPHTSEWVTAMTGPTVQLRDGAVEGWRFTFSNDTIAAAPPDTAPNFKKICSGISPKSGFIRVGVVVDYGVPALAPQGELTPRNSTTCVIAPKSANGLDVLKKVVSIRQSSQGFICALKKYPARECSAEVVISPVRLKR